LKGTVHYEVVDSVALLTVDNPPVNPLSEGLGMVFMRALLKLKQMKVLLGLSSQEKEELLLRVLIFLNLVEILLVIV